MGVRKRDVLQSFINTAEVKAETSAEVKWVEFSVLLSFSQLILKFGTKEGTDIQADTVLQSLDTHLTSSMSFYLAVY